MCAAVCALALLLALPSHAQWNVVDQNGNAIPQNNDGSYPLLCNPGGKGTSTYPQDLNSDYSYVTCVFGPCYYPEYFGGTIQYGLNGLSGGLGGGGWAQNNYYGSPYFYNGTVNEPLQGTIQNSTDAPLVARFQYTGGGTPPDYLNVLVSDSAYASAYVDSDYPFLLPLIPDSLLSAHVSVSDDLGLILFADASSLFPGSQNDPPHTAGGGRLLRLPVIAGEARVTIPVHFGVTQVNEVPYGSWEGPIGFGGASSYFNAGIGATVQMDNRAVTISSGFEPTSHKDINTSQPVLNTPEPDGTMRADTILVTENFGTADYYAHAVGAWSDNSTYHWYSALTSGSAAGTFTLPNDPPLDFAILFPSQGPNYPLSSPLQEHINLHCVDGGVSPEASANYYVTWHNEFDNWITLVDYKQNGELKRVSPIEHPIVDEAKYGYDVDHKVTVSTKATGEGSLEADKIGTKFGAEIGAEYESSTSVKVDYPEVANKANWIERRPFWRHREGTVDNYEVHGYVGLLHWTLDSAYNPGSPTIDYDEFQRAEDTGPTY